MLISNIVSFLSNIQKSSNSFIANKKNVTNFAFVIFFHGKKLNCCCVCIYNIESELSMFKMLLVLVGIFAFKTAATSVLVKAKVKRVLNPFRFLFKQLIVTSACHGSMHRYLGKISDHRLNKTLVKRGFTLHHIVQSGFTKGSSINVITALGVGDQ